MPIDREARRRKREAHIEKLKQKAERIGMLNEIIREQEARPYAEQDRVYLLGVKERLRRTECELQNMNQA